jgi:hypothetical protein
MDEENFRPIVKEIFRRLGLKARDLERADSVETPDFEVTGTSSRYIVELKIKDDDPEETESELQALSRGELVGKSVPVGPRNRLSGIIAKAVAQIGAHDPTDQAYRIVWLHSAGQDPVLHNMRFQATLFGTEDLFSLRLPEAVTCRYVCYYFHESTFYTWRYHLDAAIVTYENEKGLCTQLCINTLSPRVAEFRGCDLVQKMSGCLLDPERLHGLDNGVMIADCPFDRRDSSRVLAYLQGKYGLDHLQTIPMQKHSGKLLIDPDANAR